ncbi:MAG: biotin--[acetyl-CoA-carboxylase] ligase [Candidatus Cloacimonetes bacterium]|nr:biotin--[acetyl-CoA-carboxylase] ligase [Candidatus Cloacimonadota bacterium]
MNEYFPLLIPFLDSYIVLAQTDSTMLEMNRITRHLKKGNGGDESQRSGKHILAVQAITQTQGLGRKDNKWISPPGGLWLSLQYSHECFVPSFSLYIGHCLHKALLGLFPALRDRLAIKWTNDLMLQDRKLCGILIRHSETPEGDHLYQTGIGLNLNNPIDFSLMPYQAVSLGEEIGFPLDISYFAYVILMEIFQNVSLLTKQEEYISYCNEYLYAKNRRVRIVADNTSETGVLLGINVNGSLCLECGAPGKEIWSGTLSLC